MPCEWRQFALGELCSLITDGKHGDCEDEANSGFYFLSVKDVFDNRLVYDNARQITEKDFLETHHRTNLEPGDILFTNTGTIGRMAIAPKDPITYHTTFQKSVAILKPKRDLIEPFFLYYLLHFNNAKLSDFAAGTTQKNLLLKDFRSFGVEVPDMIEQRAIAHILGTLDEKIELNRRMNETLEAMAQARFKSWFVDFDPVRANVEGRDPCLPTDIADLFPDSFQDSELGKIPKGWQVGVLDQLIDVALGGDWGSDVQTAEKSESVRCIRGADIPDLQMGGTGKMPVRFLKPSSLEKRRLSDGNLVVEISGGSPTQSTGRSVLVSNGLIERLGMPLICSNFCRLLKLKSPTLSKFIYLWLRELYANDELLQFENGTTGIKNFAFALFSSSYKLCIPPLNILGAFDCRVSPLFNRGQVSAAESYTLAVLRDTLLPKLISGALRVRDAERFIEGKA